MQYLKRNIKYSILTFLVIILSITISISTLAKTEIYFSLYDNPQILLTTSPIPEVQNINNNKVFHAELIKVLKISELLAQKIIDHSFMSFPFPPMSFPLSFMSFPRMRESIILKNEPNGFKEPKDLLKILQFINLDLREWG